MPHRRRQPSTDRAGLADGPGEISLRLASAADQRALRRIADRDSAPIPPAPCLIAARDGEVLAGRSLRNGHAIADPFTETAGLASLLARRAGELTPAATETPADAAPALTAEATA